VHADLAAYAAHADVHAARPPDAIVDRAVAVVVDAVALLDRAGADPRIAVVAVSAAQRVTAHLDARDHGAAHRAAEAVAVVISEPHRVDRVLVHDPVAVVVVPVTDLREPVADLRVVIVAVAPGAARRVDDAV